MSGSRDVRGPAAPMLERIAAAKRDRQLGALVDAIPYARFLGLSAELVGEEVITTMPYRDRLIGNPMLPALHGGTLGALVESAAIFELLFRAETALLPKTITLTIDYLRSAAPRDTFARGSVTRHGRRIANVRVEAWQADRAAPVVTAHAVFLVMREEARRDPAAPER
ncbi:MAG: PaaI family thioesterase [Kofleriaceae bacterium]